MKLPQTLHGQLYLLAYDRQRHRFDGGNCPLFGFALRAAMLTDLYLTSHVEDRAGKPYTSRDARPDDPVLRAAFDEIAITGQKRWAELIAENQQNAPKVVRDQLKATGWLRPQQRRMLGIIPTVGLRLDDEDMVSALGERVTKALRNCIEGLPAEPRPLAVGLLGVLGQLPTVFSFTESSWHRQRLRYLTFAAIAPIVGLHQAIESHHEDVRAGMGRLTGVIG